MRHTPRPQSLVLILAITLLGLATSYASPFTPREDGRAAQAMLDLLSKSIKQSAEAITRVHASTTQAVLMHMPSAGASRKLHQDAPSTSCPASQTAV
jgi:hypothetical protein